MPGPDLPVSPSAHSPAQAIRNGTLRAGPSRAASAPPVLGATLRQVGNEPSPLQAATRALGREWEEMVMQWLTQASVRIRDQPDQHHVGIPSRYRWRAFWAAAWAMLPKQLPELVESSHLCRLFGLDKPMPQGLYEALLQVIARDAARNPAPDLQARTHAELARLVVQSSRHLPMCEVGANIMLNPLLGMIHESACRNLAVKRIFNVGTAAGSGR